MPDDTREMVFHRQLWNKIEDGIDNECYTDDCTCNTGIAISALLAVIWIHCPAEWYRSVMRADPSPVVSNGLCVTCEVRYPCRNIVAVADEFALTWGGAS